MKRQFAVIKKTGEIIGERKRLNQSDFSMKSACCNASMTFGRTTQEYRCLKCQKICKSKVEEGVDRFARAIKRLGESCNKCGEGKVEY